MERRGRGLDETESRSKPSAAPVNSQLRGKEKRLAGRLDFALLRWQQQAKAGRGARLSCERLGQKTSGVCVMNGVGINIAKRLPPGLFRQYVEELIKAGNQVAFTHDQIYRKFNTKSWLISSSRSRRCAACSLVSRAGATRKRPPPT